MTPGCYPIVVKGTHVATGYKRIVYGDHGPYLEFDESQIVFKNFKRFKKKSSLAFYDERYTENRHVELYEQKKSVNRIPNPPKGEYSKRNNRPEGYADYLTGMYYIRFFAYNRPNKGDCHYSRRHAAE